MARPRRRTQKAALVADWVGRPADPLPHGPTRKQRGPGPRRARARGRGPRDAAALCDAVMQRFLMGAVSVEVAADGCMVLSVEADGVPVP